MIQKGRLKVLLTTKQKKVSSLNITRQHFYAIWFLFLLVSTIHKAVFRYAVLLSIPFHCASRVPSCYEIIELAIVKINMSYFVFSLSRQRLAVTVCRRLGFKSFVT